MADRVHLVRHGEVDNPDHVVYADLPQFCLSEAGVAQVTEARDHLAGRPVAAVYSSPLTRAVQTARVIAQPHRLPVETTDALTEFGLSVRWRGMRWDELGERFPGEIEAYLDHPWDLPFSPESLIEMADRMKTAVVAADTRHPLGELVFVSHQDPLQAARFVLTGRDFSGFMVDKPQHAQVITLEPGPVWREVATWESSVKSGPFPPPA